MTDKAFFSTDDWQAVRSPLFVALAVVWWASTVRLDAQGSLGQRSQMTQPGDRFPANDLIAAIAHDAESHEARHDVSQHRGDRLRNRRGCPRRAARQDGTRHRPSEEAAQSGWLVDIARRRGCRQGTSDREAETIAKIGAVLAAD